MSTYERDPTTGELKQIDGMRSIDDVKALMLDLCYPIGSIYISTKNVSPQTFLGGTWKSKSGYILRGATSGVNFNSNTNDGGADSVTVSSVASHDHSVSAVSISSSGAHNHKFAYGTNAAGYLAIALTTNQSTTEGGTLSSTGSAHTHTVPAHSTQSKGSSYTVNTLPKYKNVYIWERTA